MRHIDFQRIYDEFCAYYKQTGQGESEYYSWLQALELDEANEYGHAYESFKWAKDMLSLYKEDADNKYYRILVGFPIKSMNGNVYKERDLIAAALSLKGKHPSLNHKGEYWFSPSNPKNRWGNLTIKGGKYEDGAVEAILQVPKTAVCPICNGERMTELIDDQRIVNVSLEGVCAGVCYDGSCEGFTFTDPPFTLLTTDVLPGIPLARIKPLESIMVEALKAKTNRKNMKMRKKNKVKIQTKPKEDRHQQIRQPETTVNTRSLPDPFTGTWGTPLSSDEQIDTPMDNARTVIGVNPAGPEPVMRQSEGKVSEPFADYVDFVDCVAKNSDKEDPEAYCASIETQAEENAPPEHPDAPLTGPKKDTSTIVPDMGVEPDKSSAPKLDIEQPEGAPETLPDEEQPHVDVGVEPKKTGKTDVVMGVEPVEQETASLKDELIKLDTQIKTLSDKLYGDNENPELTTQLDILHAKKQKLLDLAGLAEQDVVDIPLTPLVPCDPGYHHNPQGICVPDVDVSGERVRAIKAEYAASGLRDNIKMIEATWVNKFTVLNDAYMKLMGRSGQLEELIKQQRSEINNAGTRAEDLRVELRDVKQQFGDATTSNTKFSRLIETLRVEKDDAEGKYRKGLTVNLDLSRKLTKANEDYLQVHKQLEQAETAFKRARNEAKKIVKIKV